MVRTIEEVRQYYNNPTRLRDDVLGFRSEVLGVHLPEGWKDEHRDKHKEYPLTEEFLRGEASKYLVFAFEKALNHRGLSAGRSVEKLREWMWLLGYDEVVAFADDDANYPQYGVPVLKKVAAVLGVPLPDGIAAWEDGRPCVVGCERGCGT